MEREVEDEKNDCWAPFGPYICPLAGPSGRMPETPVSPLSFEKIEIAGQAGPSGIQPETPVRPFGWRVLTPPFSQNLWTLMA